MRGHIRGRSKGSWQVVIELEPDGQTGRRRQLRRTIQGRKKDAELLLAQLISQHELGIDAGPGQVTVDEFLQRWLRDYAEVSVGAKTYVRYAEICRLHLAPKLGSVTLAKLRPARIQQAYRELQDAGLSAQTVLHVHRVLRGALNWGVRMQMLTRNPTDATEAPRAERHEMRALAPPEIQILLDAARPTDLYHLVFVALATGVRLGEALALKWRDLDMEQRSLQIVRSLQYLPGRGLAFVPTKTHRSSRAITLSEETVAIFNDLRKRQVTARLGLGPAYDTAGDLIFCGPTGVPLAPYNVSRRFGDLAKSAGLAPLRFHDMRHSYATLLLRAGVHVKLVSQALGHSGTQLTLDTYSHAQPDLEAEAANMIDRFLVGAAK